MRRWSWQDLDMRMIEGPFSMYMTPEETSLLVSLVKSVSPRVMIEFGCNYGVTAARLLDNVSTLEKYIGIDVPIDHSPTLKCQMAEVPRGAGTFASDDQRFFLLTTEHMLAPDELERCDAVFIDGDHSYEAVVHESHLARTLLRPGGIIVWHDYNNPAVEVTQALDMLRNEGWRIDCVENSWLAFMRAEGRRP